MNLHMRNMQHLGAAETAGVGLKLNTFLQGVYFEIGILALLVFAYCVVRLLKPKSKKGEAWGSPLMKQIRAMRHAYSNGKYEGVKTMWRVIVNSSHAECCPVDVLKIVTHSILAEEGEEEGLPKVRELVTYFNSFSNPLHSLIDDNEGTKIRVRSEEDLRTLVLNRCLQVGVQKTPIAVEKIYEALQDLRGRADEETYELLLTGYSNAGDEKMIDETLRVMEGIYGHVGTRAFSIIIISALKQNELSRAMKYTKQLQESGGKATTSIVAEFFRTGAATGCVGEVLRTIKEMHNAGTATVNSEAVSYMIDDAFKRRDVNLTHRVVSMAEELKVDLHYSHYDVIVKTHVMRGDVKAFQYYADMKKNFSLSSGTCVGLINLCVDSKFVQFAEIVFKDRREIGVANLALYSSLIKLYSAMRKYDAVCELYPLMVEDGLELDEQMQAMLMTSAVKASRQDLVDQLHQASHLPGKDELYYMSNLRTCRQDRDVGRALRFKDEMKQRNLLDANAWLTVLDVCSVSGDIDSMLKIFEEMKAGGFLDELAYNRVIKGYCNSGDLDSARKMLERMQEHGFSASSVTYNFLLCRLTANGDYRGAWQIVETMHTNGIEEDSFTLYNLVKAVKVCKDDFFVHKVFWLLNKTSVDLLKDDAFLGAILDATLRVKDIAMMRRLVDQVMQSNLTPTVPTMNMLIKATGTLHRIENVRALWNELTGVRAVPPNDFSVGCMVDALVSNNCLAEAVELVDKWKDRVQMNTIIYSTLIKGYAIAKDAVGALACFETMKSSGFTPNIVTVNTLLDACHRAGATQSARKLYEQIGQLQLEPDRITFATMIKGFARHGCAEEAVAMLEEMEAVSLWPDHSIYNVIIDAATQQAKWQLADKMYENMIGKGIRPTTFTLISLLQRHGREGNVKNAEHLFRTMPSRYGFKASVQAYTCMLTVYVSNGCLQQGLQLFEKMQSEGPAPDAKAYEKLIFGCMRQQSADKASELLLDAYGVGKHGNANGKVPLDTSVIPRVVDGLATRGLAETHIAPLVQKLRAAGVAVPSSVLSATIRGVATEVKGKDVKDAEVPPWRRRNNNNFVSRAAPPGLPRRATPTTPTGKSEPGSEATVQ